MLSTKQQQAAENIQQCYQTIVAKDSNMVAAVLPQNETLFEWQHYPKGDVIDKIHHSQYFYHTHISHDSERLVEHGHFHVFLRTHSFSELAPIVVSKKHIDDPSKDNLCHIAAIAMNEYGYPTALFTLNHWVVQGKWFHAKDIVPHLDNFHIEHVQYDVTSQWVTAMIQLFQPQLIELLELRDEVIAEWQEEHPDENVWQAKSLEVTSLLALA
tara:strand:+ start:91360 stop:91998 length:639 start_codon:yes stop_codon:yes gene_type:complete